MTRWRPLWAELVHLGWPVSATLMVRVTMRTVDILVVGLVVGAAGVAALGIGDAAARIVLMTALGLGAGTIATVSQRVGAGRHHDADVAVTQSALIAGVLGTCLSVVGWLAAPAFFRVLGAEPDVTRLGVTYLRIVIATAGPRMLAVMLTRALQGAGDTRTPLVIRTIGTGVNILVTVLLVGGIAGAPRLGVTGAAIGTATGNVLSATILAAYLARRTGVIGFTPDGLWAPDTLRRIVRIGAPQVLERNVYAVGAIPLNAIVLVFGTAANAGFQIGRRVQLYALLPSRGVATAASTFMGMRVGEGDPDAGDRYGRAGIRLALLVSVAVAIPAFWLAEPVAGLFLGQDGALGVAATWIRVYAVATVARALYGVLRGAMQGAGETRAPLAATAVGIGVFALALSWLLGVQLGLGLPGVFAGVALDPLARTVLLYRWYDQGRWRRALAHPDPATVGGAADR